MTPKTAICFLVGGMPANVALSGELYSVQLVLSTCCPKASQKWQESGMDGISRGKRGGERERERERERGRDRERERERAITYTNTHTHTHTHFLERTKL